jgi:diguanylate cyclase (GGDEF)-like protein
MITRAVNDPMTVLEALQAFKPDAVLMDMYMPGCTGIEVARVIRQQPAYNALPILYLSAEQDIGKQMDAIDQGGDDFLTKPVASDVLIATVRHRCIRHRSLKDQMIRDSLTGLLDHNTILEALKQVISEAGQKQQPLCFVMIDIDHFKNVNDKFGHPAGDQVLIEVAKQLKANLRKIDILARIGGEEFSILLPETSAKAAMALAERIRTEQSDLKVIGDWQGEIKLSVSIGVSSFLTDDESFDVIFSRADKALYNAKEYSRNKVMYL